MSHAQSSDIGVIKNCLVADAVDSSALRDVIDIVGSSGALDYTRSLAEEQADMARACLGGLPESKYRQALYDMVDFAVNRQN